MSDRQDIPPAPRLPPVPTFTAAIPNSTTKTTMSQRQKEWTLQLTQAIERGNQTMVVELLKKGVNIDVKIVFSRTPLIHAIELKHFDIARVLVEYGADVNKDKHNLFHRKPLHIVTEFFNFDLLKLLLLHGAEVNAKDAIGATPIMLACHRGHMDAVELLYAHGADLNAVDNVGKTAFHRATEGRSHHHNRVRILQFLQEKGVDINAVDNFGHNALGHCIFFHDLEMVQYLVKIGLDVSCKNAAGISPLTFACHPLFSKNLYAVVMSFIDNKENIWGMPQAVQQMTICHSTQKALNNALKVVQLLSNAGGQLLMPDQGYFRYLISVLLRPEKHHILCYLILSGSILLKDLPENVAENHSSTLEMSLMKSCQYSIRSHLSTVVKSRDIYCSINMLPLPNRLKEYLNLSDFDDMISSNYKLKDFHACTQKP